MYCNMTEYLQDLTLVVIKNKLINLKKIMLGCCCIHDDGCTIIIAVYVIVINWESRNYGSK